MGHIRDPSWIFIQKYFRAERAFLFISFSLFISILFIFTGSHAQIPYFYLSEN